jgi:hypothetical protein
LILKQTSVKCNRSAGLAHRRVGSHVKGVHADNAGGYVRRDEVQEHG